MGYRLRVLAGGLSILVAGLVMVRAQVPEGTVPKVAEGLELTRWAREPMLRSPVALSFDDTGRLYVVETARRGTVDIDIRSHPDWLLEDLANQSVDDLRRFFRTRMAPERSAENAGWLRDLNGDGSHDWRDLTTVKERVHRLEDTLGAGRADRAVVFAESFHEEITGVAAGVMPWGRDVFVTVYPDLWRLRDTNGDGVADTQESVARGFGVHAAFDGHDLHGLTEGPDGRIYFSVGDNGFSVTNREGRALHYPNTGGVLRMNPDGSELEVFASGLRNPQEIAFDEFGNLFAVDNDGDLAGERERFVVIPEGSDAGWRLHWQFRDPGWARQTRQPDYNPWTDEKMWVPYFAGQPAHLVPAITNYSVGPGSFKYNPGTALNERYRAHFFLIQFPVAKVTAFQVRPRGAGFEMVNEHTLLSGMMASAVNFGPDGALYVGDWDGMWTPSGKGSIWKVDDATAATSALRREVSEFLRDGVAHRTATELVRWLGHADQRVRLRAQGELVRRGAREELRSTAASEAAPLLARVHALWGLGVARDREGVAGWPWADREVQVRAQCAKVAGEMRAPAAVGRLTGLLKDESPAVRFQAALALGKLGAPEAFPALVTLLVEDAGLDPMLRHAGVMGLVGAASPEKLVGLARHASPAVRVAAVVALRRLRNPGASAFLDDDLVEVRREAVRAIHDDRGIAAAMPALAGTLGAWSGAAEPGMVRRVLSANLKVGTADAARRLGEYASQGTNPEPLRLEALECLGEWARSTSLDRVEGYVQTRGARDPGLGDAEILRRFEAITRAGGRSVLNALVRLVLENDLAVDASSFAPWAQSAEQPAGVRAQALEWLARKDPARLGEALLRAAADPELEVRLAALRIEAAHVPEALVRRVVNESSGWSIPERQAAFALLGPIVREPAARWIGAALDDLAAGRLPAELAVDVWSAAAQRSEPELARKLSEMEGRLAAGDALAPYRAVLAGGDVRRGEAIFRHHANAQCVRCHDAGGEGQQVGPVLKGVATRLTAEQILEAMVEPSARIADGFATYSVETRDGTELDGVRLAETPEWLTLRLANGEVKRLARGDLRRQSVSTVSAMPPMGTVLTRFELRDLIAYLKTLN